MFDDAVAILGMLDHKPPLLEQLAHTTRRFGGKLCCVECFCDSSYNRRPVGLSPRRQGLAWNVRREGRDCAIGAVDCRHGAGSPTRLPRIERAGVHGLWVTSRQGREGGLAADSASGWLGRMEMDGSHTPPDAAGPRGQGGSDRHVLSRRKLVVGAGGLVAVAAVALGARWADRSRSVRIRPATALAAALANAQVVDTGGPFLTSNVVLTDHLNEFWQIYTVATGTPATLAALNAHTLNAQALNPAWDEWEALKFAWTAEGSYRETMKNGYLQANRINGLDGTSGEQPNGYVWSWTTREAWPDANAFHDNVGSFHFDQIPRFVIGGAMLALWSRDTAFAAAFLPRAEWVMDNYLFDTMGGSSGVLTEKTVNSVAPSDGLSGKGRPGNYMDQVRFGHQDAWVNAAFYTSLQMLAEAERFAGNTTKADSYDAVATAFPAKYNAAFWRTATNRYVGWVDSEGYPHDAGYTYVNLEAVARGIATPTQAWAVLQLLNSPAQATDSVGVPAHPDNTEVYQLVVAPRANTLDIPLFDWDGWSDPSTGRRSYGAQVENGGAFLWEAYYDVLARLETSGADDALQQLWRALGRIKIEAERLTFWMPGHAYDQWGESFVQLGTNDPFPESGIVPAAVVFGFMGLQATAQGLSVSPRLPRALVDLGVHNVGFGSTGTNVTVRRGRVIAEETAATSYCVLGPNPVVSQSFAVRAPFNEVAIAAYASFTMGSTNPGMPAGTITLALERKTFFGWHLVGSASFAHVYDGSWLPMALRTQPDGTYRLRATGSGGVGWYGASASHLSFRISNAPQAVVAVHPVRSPDGGTLLSVPAPFDRVLVRGSALSLELLRQVGAAWQPIASQTFAASDNAVLWVADQPAGMYRLTSADDTATVEEIQRTVYSVTIGSKEVSVLAGDAYLWNGA